MQLLDVHRALCAATHTLLATAHVLHSESLADRHDESPPGLGCFGRFYRSFTNACSPLVGASAASRDVPRLLGMLSAGEPTLRNTWASFQEERTFTLRLLEMSRRTEERTVRAHLRDRVREEASADASRRRRRRRSPSVSSSLSRSTDESNRVSQRHRIKRTGTWRRGTSEKNMAVMHIVACALTCAFHGKLIVVQVRQAPLHAEQSDSETHLLISLF